MGENWHGMAALPTRCTPDSFLAAPVLAGLADG
jgi:hypothetical protein